MKIQNLFNTNIEEIASRKFNILIAISIGNKWFLSTENLEEYLRWALKHTKDKVLVLIADKIQIINYNVRNMGSKEYNLRRALKEGQKIKELIEDVISKFTSEQKEQIEILKWDDYKARDKFYPKILPLINREFKKNHLFKSDILNLIKSSIKDKEFSEEEYFELSKYLIEEFALCYSGVYLDNNYYGLYLYPTLFPISLFIEKIQQGKIFSELTKKLPREKVALV